MHCLQLPTGSYVVLTTGPPPPAAPQIGMAEMKDVVLTTGGMAVQTDTFTNPVFKDSLKRVFLKEGEDGFLGISSNATMEVRGSSGGGGEAWTQPYCLCYSLSKPFPPTPALSQPCDLATWA